MASLGAARAAAYDRAARADHWRATYAGLDAWQRHERLMNQLACYGGGGAAADGAGDPAAALAHTRTDADVLRESYRFIRSSADDAPATWEVRLARRYYDRLFREYALADLSRHKEQKVGLRWRTEAEVRSGKGQFTCGAKGCDARAGLVSYEVMFRYSEEGQSKAALVKLRACPECAAKLNYGRSSAARYQPRSSGGGAAAGPTDAEIDRWLGELFD